MDGNDESAQIQAHEYAPCTEYQYKHFLIKSMKGLTATTMIMMISH